MASSLWVGIDVSSDWLDVAIGADGSVLRVSNDAAGYQEIVEHVGTTPISGFIFESTGIYHRGLMQFLSDKGLRATLLQPKFLKNFRLAGNKLAKTDVLDAQLLARYGETFRPRSTVVKSASLQELTDLVAYHRQLTNMAVRVRNHQRNLHEPPWIQDQRAGMLAFLDTRIADASVQIAHVIAGDPVLCHRDALLQSVPAIGPVISAALLAGMPELGSLTRKQVGALAGLAPMMNQSGKKAGLVTIKDGRKDIRTKMFLAARHPYAHAVVASHRKQMRENCASYREAITATARWFLCVINAMVRDNLTWKELDIVKAAA